jgi:acyl carrier protein
MALSRTEIKEKLKGIMEYAIRDNSVDLDSLDEASSLVTDLGLNSVGILYIVIAIEEEFSIEFENVGFSDFKTVGDVVDYIEEKVNA